MKRGKNPNSKTKTGTRRIWSVILAAMLIPILILLLIELLTVAADFLHAADPILPANPSALLTTSSNSSPDHQHNYGEEYPLGKTEDGYLFAQECSICGHVREHTYAAIMTFIDDDAKTEALLHWERIIDATGIEMTCALIPSKIEDTTNYDSWYSYAGWDLLDRMKDKGVDYIHHTYSHQRLSTFTQQQLHDDFSQSRDILSAHGIDSQLLAYPFYDHNDTVRQIAALYFSAAFGGTKDVGTSLDTSNYAIRRRKITDSTNIQTITFPDGRTADCRGIKSAESFQNELDQAVEAGEWLVYVSHAYDSPSGKYYFDEAAEQRIIDFCLYAQERGDVKIVSATDGYCAASPLKK